MSYSSSHPIYHQIGTGRIFDINNTNYRNAMLPVSNSGSFQFDSWTMGSEKLSNYQSGYATRSFYIRNQPKQLQNQVPTLQPLASPEIWSQWSKTSQNETPVPSSKEKRTPGIDRNSHPEKANSSKTTRSHTAASHSRQINDNSVESPKQRNKSKTPVFSQKADTLPITQSETPLSTKQTGKSPGSSKTKRSSKENQIKKTRSPLQNKSPVEKETAIPPNQGKRITQSNQSASGRPSTRTNRSPLPPKQTERMVNSNRSERSSPPNSKIRSPCAHRPIPCNQTKSPTPASKQAGMCTPTSYPAQVPLSPLRQNDTEGHVDLKVIPAENERLIMTCNEYKNASPPTKTVLSPHAESFTPSPSIQTEKPTTSPQVECSQTPVQAERPIVSPRSNGNTRPTTLALSGNRMVGLPMSYYRPEMLFPPKLVDDPILPFLQAGRLLPLPPYDDNKHCPSAIQAERHDNDNIMAYNQTTRTTSPQHNRSERLPPRYIEMNNNDAPKSMLLPTKRSRSPTVVEMVKPLHQVDGVMVPNQSAGFGLPGQREQPVEEYKVVQKSRYFDIECVSYKKTLPSSVKKTTRPLTTDSPERTHDAASKVEDPKWINDNVWRIIEQYRTCYEILSLEKKSSKLNPRSCSTDQRKLAVPGDKRRHDDALFLFGESRSQQPFNAASPACNTSVDSRDLYRVKSQTQERYNCNINTPTPKVCQVQGGQQGGGNPRNDDALPPSQCIQTNNNTSGPAIAHTLTPGAYQNDAPSASQNVKVLNQSNRQHTYCMDANGNSLYYNVPPPRISPPSVSEGPTSNGFQQRKSLLDDVDVWVPPDVEAPLDGYRPLNLNDTKPDEVKDRPLFLTSGWNSVEDKWQQRPFTFTGNFAPPGCMASDYLPLYRHCLPPLVDDLPPLDGTDYDPGQEAEMDEDDGVTGEGCHDVFTSYFGENREDKIRALSRVEIARVVVCL